jgi:outer membrane autotransporter protein
MLGGRDSRFALVVEMPYDYGLNIGKADSPGSRYVFAGGTSVLGGGYIEVAPANTLVSNVVVDEWSSFYLHGNLEGNLLVEKRNPARATGDTYLFGHVTGNVTNAGALAFLGRVDGNVTNNGRMAVRGVATPDVLLNGNFTQSPSGTFVFQLAPGDARFSPAPLQITGRADLAGTLELGLYNDLYDNTYPIPATGSYQILHAADGVFGTFAQWTSPGLFIEGAPRYGSNDVWFDLSRLSVQATMAATGFGSPLVLSTAANLDRVFTCTDRYALMAPGLHDDAQRQLLASAASVLHIADVGQASRTLESLSGAAHADALQASLQHGVADRATGQRLASMQAGLTAGAWSNDATAGHAAGFDQWLEPRLLAGVSAGQATEIAGEGYGEKSRRSSPHASAYLRWFGDGGWYVGGSAGYAQQTLALGRTIDLGRAGRWRAHAEHRFDIAGLQGEVGRQLSLAGGTLTPYLALDATALRSERAVEQGSTGFELAMQPARQAQLSGEAGLRFGRDWGLGEDGWLRMDIGARWQRPLADAGAPLRAAFTGAPDLWFDVPGHAATSSGWLGLGLQGGFRRHWTWSFDASRQFTGDSQAGQAWRLGLQRVF